MGIAGVFKDEQEKELLEIVQRVTATAQAA